jgi:glycosyltransferase involved in cell wall biosynthesis
MIQDLTKIDDKTGWPFAVETSPQIYNKSIDWPKISIVTPTFNQGQYIEQTIQSIMDQDYPNLEYIIIDGGSTDNTPEIIKKYEKHLTYWVSESDRGQAHAINKGLERSTGEIFQWINSDDYLEKGALFKIAEAFSNPKVDVVAGKTVYFKNEAFEEPIQQAKLSSKGILKWEKGVKFVQPGVWLRKEKMISCGGIDEQFHFCFDWDLYIRYLQKFPMVCYIPGILVYFRLHENSKTVSFINKFHHEEELILKKYTEFNQNEFLKINAQNRLDRKKMYAHIDLILNNSAYSKYKKIKELIKSIYANPKINLNRITLGAFKQILLK